MCDCGKRKIKTLKAEIAALRDAVKKLEEKTVFPAYYYYPNVWYGNGGGIGYPYTITYTDNGGSS